MIGINPDCPPGVALLADHLDASLAAGEDLLASTLAARADLDEADPQAAPEALDTFVRRLLQLESSLVLRLLQARRLSVEIGRADPTLKGVAALFRAQTDTLHDLVAGAGRSAEGALARAGDSYAYIRSRGLIAPEAAAPSPFETLAVDDSFRIGGVVALSQILDFVSTTLDLLDVRFGLYMPDLPDEPLADRAEAPREVAAPTLGSLAQALGIVRKEASERPVDSLAAAVSEIREEERVAAVSGEQAEAEVADASGESDDDAPADVSAAASPQAEVDEQAEVARPTPYRSLSLRIAEIQQAPDGP
jgi:hypothetical protein